jgi:hypothetical protein
MFFNFSMDGEDTAWLVVLEKKGLHQAVGILENYGIDCETDVSLLDRDDFSELSSNGLKPMEGKKLERWCNAVRARAENMLTSSLNTPAGAALPSSEALNVLTLPAYRPWVNSQVLRTVHALHQEGKKRRSRRPRSC